LQLLNLDANKVVHGWKFRVAKVYINHLNQLCLICEEGKNNGAQHSSNAAGGGFYNVQPGTAAWLYFVDEVKNFCWALFVEPELLLIVAHSW